MTKDNAIGEASAAEIVTQAGLRRLEYIDGLRALAALWVVLHHYTESAAPKQVLRLPVVGGALMTLGYGQAAVMVFLALSGFCLYYPLALKSPAAPTMRLSYPAFMARRARRILPPYFAAGALCLVLIALLPAMRDIYPGAFWNRAFPITLPVIGSHVVLVHNLFAAHYNKIDYPMWSIGLEWQLYLLFPLLVWLFRRAGPLPVLVGTMLVMVAARMVHGPLPSVAQYALASSPLGYLVIFALGMQAAQITARGGPTVPRRWLWAACLGAFAAVRIGTPGGLRHDLLVSAGTFTLLLLAADARSRTHRWLSAPWLVKIGLFSYSLYLLHAPILHLCWVGLTRLGWGQDAVFAGLVLLATPVIIGVSYLFFRVFEKPFIGQTRKRDAVERRTIS